MIELEAVTVVFGRRRELFALEEIDLVVGNGEMVVVTGLLAPEAGTVRLFGHDLQRLRRSSIPHLRRRVGVVHQDLRLLPERSALANVAVPLEVMAMPRREINGRAAEALGSVGLAWKADTPVTHLSLGEQQRVAIARALVTEPAVLIADEPTGNLDRGHTEDLLWQLSELNGNGTTIVITTNDHDVIEAAGRNRWRRLMLESGRLGDWAHVNKSLDRSGDTAPNVVQFPVVAAAGGHAE